MKPKPRIKKVDFFRPLYRCTGAGITGQGYSPAEAYKYWELMWIRQEINPAGCKVYDRLLGQYFYARGEAK